MCDDDLCLECSVLWVACSTVFCSGYFFKIFIETTRRDDTYFSLRFRIMLHSNTVNQTWEIELQYCTRSIEIINAVMNDGCYLYWYWLIDTKSVWNHVDTVPLQPAIHEDQFRIPNYIEQKHKLFTNYTNKSFIVDKNIKQYTNGEHNFDGFDHYLKKFVNLMKFKIKHDSMHYVGILLGID